MELPYGTREQIEEMLTGIPVATLRETYARLSDRYRAETGHGRRLLSETQEAAVYAAARMPATFGAVTEALFQTRMIIGETPIDTVLDVGAGTGTAGLAVRESLSPGHIVCLEREPAMREVGSRLLPEAEWIPADLTTVASLPEADMVIASYVLGEMTETDCIRAAQRLWSAAGKLLLIVEPGTPAAFARMMAIRSCLTELGAYIAAPCPHSGTCRVAEDDWCHFTCRVQRTRLHRELKGGDAPFEDEKYSYLAFTRTPCPVPGARVLRHPDIGKGQIRLRVCAADANTELTLRKRDGGRYKQARKLSAGDLLRDTEE